MPTLTKNIMSGTRLHDRGRVTSPANTIQALAPLIRGQSYQV